MQLSRDASAPLYRQIAERLEYEIVTGRRLAEERLPSLRDAADGWGVNLHTVRKAYHELEAAGLAEIGPRGAHVAPLPRPRPDGDTIEAAVEEFLARVRATHGAGPAEIRRALERLEAETASSSRVSVVECSRTLSRDLARQIAERWGFQTDAVDLHEDASLPDGRVIGTYFHADHLRDRLVGRAADLHLVRIRPRETLVSEIASRATGGSLRRLVIIDRLPGSARDLAADFEARAGPGTIVETRILSDPLLAFPSPDRGTAVIASPQTWDRLTPELRARRDVAKLEYEIEPRDLETLPTHLGLDPG